ncbi:thioredoxin domain-containing protein [Nocardiopsis akebiae]|uniref:Thioredoxin domain-containing protein n=1 Tax=Nocardiopsis akebiae TaxID=2831968 RepID=A0ABX8BZN1_9ACTN|nr:DsbA family protein [Nocardiopsis akebiae]QUX27417.1 thioredoxin domain-containing protein [Nocardiopsis akebiae]
MSSSSGSEPGRGKKQVNARPSPGAERGRGRTPDGGGGGSWRGLLFAGLGLVVVAGLLVANRAVDDRAQEPAAREPAADSAPHTAGADDQVPDQREFGALLARRDPADPAAMGEVDAPVVMVAYSDYNCPYCGRWARETQPELMHYVERGDLRIEWRDFPVITGSSETVSHAARAAGKQGGFWEFHEAYFAHGEKFEGEALEEVLDEIVAELGMDPERFEEDRHGDEAAAMVSRDFAEAQGIGVTSTPAFLVNGQPLMGAQPLSAFVSAVEDALADAGRDGDG